MLGLSAHQFGFGLGHGGSTLFLGGHVDLAGLLQVGAGRVHIGAGDGHAAACLDLCQLPLGELFEVVGSGRGQAAPGLEDLGLGSGRVDAGQQLALGHMVALPHAQLGDGPGRARENVDVLL